MPHPPLSQRAHQRNQAHQGPPGPNSRARLSHLPARLTPLLVLGALLWAGPADAADSFARCNAWQRSHGVDRILLGNAIGASHYLTKRQKQLESPPDAPIALYDESDLQRVCSTR